MEDDELDKQQDRGRTLERAGAARRAARDATGPVTEDLRMEHDGHDVVKLAQTYVAMNAAESGADVLMGGLIEEVERLRSVITDFANCVEKQAFNIPAPNPHTPILVSLANQARFCRDAIANQ